MATRSNIMVTDGDSYYDIYYKHFDGDENHDLLVDLLKKANTRDFDIITSMVSEMDGVEYDLWDQNIHGDIEYLNVIDTMLHTLTTYAVDGDKKKEIKHFNF